MTAALETISEPTSRAAGLYAPTALMCAFDRISFNSKSGCALVACANDFGAFQLRHYCFPRRFSELTLHALSKLFAGFSSSREHKNFADCKESHKNFDVRPRLETRPEHSKSLAARLSDQISHQCRSHCGPDACQVFGIHEAQNFTCFRTDIEIFGMDQRQVPLGVGVHYGNQFDARGSKCLAIGRH